MADPCGGFFQSTFHGGPDFLKPAFGLSLKAKH
jgi:hypothetical protein